MISLLDQIVLPNQEEVEEGYHVEMYKEENGIDVREVLAMVTQGIMLDH